METPALAVPAAPSGSDKVWSMLCHLSFFLGVGFLLPLVVYLAMRKESDFVANHAREALNFHITVIIYALCCIPLAFILIGVPLLICIGLATIVLGIIAAIKASNNQYYHYPATIRLVR